jgi:HSP20 family molecular chaperone IbpA
MPVKMDPDSKNVERMILLRREAEKIVRELFQPENGSGVRLVGDLRTNGTSYVLEVELPGVHPSEVRVYALADAIVVEGQKAPDLPEGVRPAYERADRVFGAFRRVFDLPGPADLSKASASLSRGLLTVEAPCIVDRRGRARAIEITLDPKDS